MGVEETQHIEDVQSPVLRRKALHSSDLEKQVNGIADSASECVTEDDDLAVLSLRNLLFDICNQNGGGHGGSAIGMAAIGVALFKHTMRFNPSNPDWFDRDRFVLSNGKRIVC
jgi:hypothetical protein